MRYIYILIFLTLGCSTRNRGSENIELTIDSTQSLNKIVGLAPEEHCDSIPRNYFQEVKFPINKPDSLNESDIDTRKYLPFSICDNLLFGNDRTDIQNYSYISILDTTDYYSVLVYREMDMENCVFIFSFDMANKAIDSEILFCMGGGLERQTDTLIDDKIVNYLREEKKAIFMDNKCISSYREYYTLKDTLTDLVITEIGKQRIIEYQLDKLGRFKKIKEDSFEKEYSKIKYWYN